MASLRPVEPNPVLTLVYDAGIEPVTLAEVDHYLKLDLFDCPDAENEAATLRERALIEQLIKSARKQAEAVTARALTNQTWQFWLDEFPTFSNRKWNSAGRFLKQEIRLAKPPVHEATVLYYDENEELQILDPTWYVITKDFIPYLRLKEGYTWPSVGLTDSPVTVSFRCGFYRASTADSPGEYDTVPSEIKTWIMLKVGELYENRERSGADRLYERNFADALLAPYEVLEVAYAGW